MTTIFSRSQRLFFLKWDYEQAYESFACYFAGQGIPEPILYATYQVLAHRIFFVPFFPVEPQDSLKKVYGIDCYRNDDMADLMNVIWASGQLDFCRPVPAFLPCETVADLVYLLAARCSPLYLLGNQTCWMGASDKRAGER